MRNWLGVMFAAVTLAGNAAPVRADRSVYVDGLEAGWQNWSWGTALHFTNTAPVRGSGGTSISAQYTSPWGGIYLHTDAHIDVAGFTSFRFSIHGGTTGGQSIRVVAYDGALAEGGSVTIDAPAAGTWTDVSIPVASFGTALISGIVWQESRGQAQPVFYLDDIRFIAGTPPPVGGPQLSVDVSADRHAISPHIYGMNFAGSALAAELRLPVNRWGGNATTRYNWQLDVSNRAMDWYFENIPEDNVDPGNLPTGSMTDRFVEANRSSRTDSIITVPLIGWTPKARSHACGFSVAKYGPQQSTDPWRPDCGNGRRTDGSVITGNDPHDTSTEIAPGFVTSWMAHLAGQFGSAAEGGVRFYNLDNEPMLWNDTHRDVHPAPTSYDEIRDRTFSYAAAIKQADPAAMTLGPVLWGWTAYFYSAADAAGGGDWWNRRPDRKAHGDVPFVAWYLQQMQTYEQTTGIRILDYLDLHYYPQAANVSLKPAGDPATQQLRLRSTRSLWDPAYVDESWVAEPVRLIPRMRDWVNTYYPGTRLAMTEYNWGGYEHINGALAHADVLGIFGRERLDLATLWTAPQPTEPVAFAFRMFRNFDGAGSRFADTSVRAASGDQSRVSVYASVDGDRLVTIMLINKTAGALTCPLTLAGFSPSLPSRVYRYSAADLTRIVRLADAALAPTNEVVLPGSSITLFAIPRAGPASDFDRDGDVDAADLAHLAACGSGAGIPQTNPGCRDADLDGDGDVDSSDFGRFQRDLRESALPGALPVPAAP